MLFFVLGQSAFGDKLKYALAGMLTCLVAYVCFDRKAGQSQLTLDAHEPALPHEYVWAQSDTPKPWLYYDTCQKMQGPYSTRA